MDWVSALQQAKSDAVACVLVSIVKVEGSAPRGVGARLVVGPYFQADTIGGGSLEHKAIERARRMLVTDRPARSETHQFSLGRQLSQCCGGRVTLQFDVIPASQVMLHVFGAGHVAAALANIVAQLPWHTTFYDFREDWLRQIGLTPAQQGVIHTKTLGANPFLAVEQCPDKAHYLVMTHDHALDYELVEAILTRGDSRYCGLIASSSKAVSFKSRLQRKGFADTELAQLTAPIGETVKTGNLPMEVAVAAVADILSRSQSLQTNQTQSLLVDALEPGTQN
ncbi:MAG: xanthine dehydrogenase accessory protein XdhC [Granulosicoccaceae bacterium]